MVLGLADAAGRSLGIQQAAKTLPVTAISLTPEQVRSRVFEELRWIALVWFGLGLMFAAFWLFGDIAPERRGMFLWTPAGLTVICLVVGGFKWRSRAGYQDPLVRVEVSDSEVTVRGRFGNDRRGYDGLVVTDILTHSPKNSIRFEGIEMETALGPIRLGDESFTQGNAAAGAILKRMDELGVPLQLRGGFFS